MTNIPSETIRTLPKYATMALFPTLSSISPPMGIQIKVLEYISDEQTPAGHRMTYAKLTIE
jgi:hypothetical protein